MRRGGCRRIVAQVACDALGTRDHVAVGQHNAFRTTGAAGGVEDGQQVGVDNAVTSAVWRGNQVGPQDDGNREAD